METVDQSTVRRADARDPLVVERLTKTYPGPRRRGAQHLIQRGARRDLRAAGSQWRTDRELSQPNKGEEL